MSKLYNILIIDDEPNNLELLSILLEKYASFEFELYKSASIDKAKQVLSEHAIQIIFTDYKMPINNGSHFINEITDKKTQLVLCTAFDFKKFVNDFNRPVYFLQKPIDFDVFKDMLHHIYITLKAYEDDLIL
ncbi:MAG: response regulator [Bacteroidetes bacterium]|nr:response regulator [Bacteroidota bacterium]